MDPSNIRLATVRSLSNRSLIASTAKEYCVLGGMFSSCWDKIRRADEHIQAVKDDILGWRNTNPIGADFLPETRPFHDLGPSAAACGERQERHGAAMGCGAIAVGGRHTTTTQIPAICARTPFLCCRGIPAASRVSKPFGEVGPQNPGTWASSGNSSNRCGGRLASGGTSRESSPKGSTLSRLPRLLVITPP